MDYRAPKDLAYRMAARRRQPEPMMASRDRSSLSPGAGSRDGEGIPLSMAVSGLHDDRGIWREIPGGQIEFTMRRLKSLTAVPPLLDALYVAPSRERLSTFVPVCLALFFRAFFASSSNDMSISTLLSAFNS